MDVNINYNFCFLILWLTHSAKSMSLENKHSYFMDNSDADGDVADFIVSKGYLPREQDLPKASMIKNIDNDVTYLLSKLSDDELIKLLNDQPKKKLYDLNDIVKIAVGSKLNPDSRFVPSNNIDSPKRDNFKLYEQPPKKRFTVAEKDKPNGYFKLNEKPVIENFVRNDAEANYAALQKINNLLNIRPIEEVEVDDKDKSAEEDEKRELLFDVLVNQLKTLCCKRNKQSKRIAPKQNLQFKSLLNDIMPTPQQDTLYAALSSANDKRPLEYMFLIINDEIKSNGSDEIISVDPDSLERNSSVLLLGPITTPLADTQLKSVMNRISNELSKPDYLPLLQQLSEGTLTGSKIRLMKSLISGPETRRYIKPHRCNHQSPLAKVYGGPKWIICTGYLNLNTPSLYDRK